MSRRSLPTDLLLGALAGTAATWLMDQATNALYEREPREIKKRENEARGNKNAYEIAAEKAAELAGVDLSKKQRKKAGEVIHWSLGIGAGVMYGALRNQIPALGLGSGLAYGVLFWLAMDEGAVTALGLTPPPNTFPWQTHARGLAGHLVLGAAIESVFDLADAI